MDNSVDIDVTTASHNELGLALLACKGEVKYLRSKVNRLEQEVASLQARVRANEANMTGPQRVNAIRNLFGLPSRTFTPPESSPSRPCRECETCGEIFYGAACPECVQVDA